MAYNRVFWENRVVEKPMTYNMVKNEDGTVTLARAPGAVYQQGKPVNAENLGHMDDGIFEAHSMLDNLMADQPWDMILNGYFFDPLNMGGQNTYTGGACGLAQWECISDETKIVVHSGYGVTISKADSTVDVPVGIRQRILMNENSMWNEEVTLAVCTAYQDEITLINTTLSKTLSATADYINGSSVRLYSDSTAEGIPIVYAEIHVPASVKVSIGVKWIRLLRGTYTLENLPVNMIRNKRLEALLCGISLTPRNLLRNSNFLNPVNLAGRTTQTGYALFIPGWWSYGHSPHMLALTEQGLKIDSTDTSNPDIMTAYQVVAEKVKPGEAYTLMLWMADGTMHSCIGIVPSDAGEQTTVKYYALPAGNGGMYMQVRGDHLEVLISAFSGYALEIQHAGLFKGAYTNDLRPSYTVPKYTDELMESLHYVQIRSSATVNPSDLCPPMRATPTIRQLDDGRYEYLAELE